MNLNLNQVVPMLYCSQAKVNLFHYDFSTAFSTGLNCVRLFFSLNGETSQQNEKTCTTCSYSKMFSANDSSMNGTGNAYV